MGARRSEAGTYKFFRVPAKWAIRKLAAFLTEALRFSEERDIPICTMWQRGVRARLLTAAP